MTLTARVEGRTVYYSLEWLWTVLSLALALYPISAIKQLRGNWQSEHTIVLVASTVCTHFIRSHLVYKIAKDVVTEVVCSVGLLKKIDEQKITLLVIAGYDQ